MNHTQIFIDAAIQYQFKNDRLEKNTTTHKNDD